MSEDLSKYERLDAKKVYNLRQTRSAATIKKKSEMWLNNIKVNREHFIKGNCSIPGMVIFIVSAGPSLEKNIEQLSRIPKSSKGMIITVDAALPFLVEKNIVPDFCISIDGDSRMWEMVNDCKTLDTSKIKLFCTIATCPELVASWKGPKYFFMLRSGTADYDAKVFNMSRTYKSKRGITEGELITYDDLDLIYDGIKPDLIPGGNVTSAAFMVAMYKMGAWKAVFCGFDLSWADNDNFYAGKKNKNMGLQRVGNERTFVHANIYGVDVKTNASLLSFKQTHEDYAKAFPKRVVNATEGGIFGVENNGEKMNDIEFITLEKAINKYIFLEGI